MLTKENVIKKIEKRKDVFYLDKKSFFFPTWRTYENKHNISFGIVFDNDLIIIFTYLFNEILVIVMNICISYMILAIVLPILEYFLNIHLSRQHLDYIF